jgi:hypothetical protein
VYALGVKPTFTQQFYCQSFTHFHQLFASSKNSFTQSFENSNSAYSSTRYFISITKIYHFIATFIQLLFVGMESQSQDNQDAFNQDAKKVIPWNNNICGGLL